MSNIIQIFRVSRFKFLTIATSAKTGGPVKPSGLIEAISGVFVRAGRRWLFLAAASCGHI